MANVQRGEQRQYIEHVADMPADLGELGQSLGQIVDAGLKIHQQAEQTKRSDALVEFNSQMMRKNNEINLKYSLDPYSPDADKERKQAFEDISQNIQEQYKISPLAQREWIQDKNEVNNRFKIYNTQWAIQQNQQNAVNNMQSAVEKMQYQAYDNARNGISREQLMLQFANDDSAIRKGFSKDLGDAYISKALENNKRTYAVNIVSGYAETNPLQAEALMKDKGFRNDIGDSKTLEQLDSYVQNAVLQHHKKVAVSDMCNALRTLNSPKAIDMLDGKASFPDVMKFVNNKNLSTPTKELIASIYNVGAKQRDYVLNLDKGIIEKKSSGGGGGGSGRTVPVDAKLSQHQKEELADTLDMDMQDLIATGGAEKINIKDVKKNKSQKGASGILKGFFDNVALMQARIDTAYKTKAIDKNTRNKYVNGYIEPVLQYAEKNLEQFDEKDGKLNWWGKKLGYGAIEEKFSTKGLKGNDLKIAQRQKLFALNYYKDELDKASQEISKKTGKDFSIFDIEGLTHRQQQKIYKIAGERALKRAKRWTNEPQYYFAKEYPDIYSIPYKCLGQKQALQAVKNVAERLYKKEFEDDKGLSTIELKDYADKEMVNEIIKTHNQNQIKAGQILQDAISMERTDPKNFNELEKRVNELGIDINDFVKDAREKGYVTYHPLRPPHLSEYVVALRLLERAKALQDKNKKG